MSQVSRGHLSFLDPSVDHLIDLVEALAQFGVVQNFDGNDQGEARVMKSCPGACSSLIPDLLRIWACRRLVSAVIVLTRRASLRTISRRHGHGIAPRLRGWFQRSVSRPWPQGSGPTR